MTKCSFCGLEIKEDEEVVRDEVTQLEYHLSCHEIAIDIFG